MKKQQIKKLSLQKSRISDLKQSNVKGGDFTCPTFEETVCFTFCFPGQACQFPAGC